MSKLPAFIAITFAVLTLTLTACGGSLAGQLVDYKSVTGLVQVLTSPTAAASVFLVDAVAQTAGALNLAVTAPRDLPPGTSFTATITESEIEAYLNRSLEGGGYGETITVHDVTVVEGYLEFTCTLTLPPFGARIPGSGVAALSVDTAGRPVIEVVRAEFSHLEAPAESLAALNQALKDAIQALYDEGQADVRFTDFAVTEDGILISGYGP